jgi:chromosomal replication initiator protein
MEYMNLDQLWQSALAEIELQISRPNFATWFNNSSLLEKQNGVALISLPNNFCKEWVENKYCNIVLAAIRNIDETTKKVEFIVTPQARLQKAKQLKEKQIIEEVGQQIFTEFKTDPETNLNPRYTLDSFVVGKSNELVYAATQAIIKEVGYRYNPLFIYGGVGWEMKLKNFTKIK